MAQQTLELDGKLADEDSKRLLQIGRDNLAICTMRETKSALHEIQGNYYTYCGLTLADTLDEAQLAQGDVRCRFCTSKAVEARLDGETKYCCVCRYENPIVEWIRF